MIATVGVTVHPSVTGPANPEPATIVMLAEEVPPGAVASGFIEAGTVKVKSVCAEAAERKPSTAHIHKTTSPACLLQGIHFEVNLSSFNMSRLVFKYLRFLGRSKRCPHALHPFRPKPLF